MANEYLFGQNRNVPEVRPQEWQGGMTNADVKSVRFNPSTGRVEQFDLYSDQSKGGSMGPPVPGMQLPEPENVGWLKGAAAQAGQATQSPGFSRLTGTIAQAFGRPGSPNAQIGGALQQMGAARQQQAMLAGKELTGFDAFGLTPADRANVAQQVLAGQRMDLEGRRVGALEASVEQRGALGGRQLDLTDKFGKTADQAYKQAIDVAQIRADAMRGGGPSGSFSLGNLPVGDWNQPVLTHSGTGQMVPVTGAGRRMTPNIPTISPAARKQHINVLYEEIRKQIPTEGGIAKFLPFIGNLQDMDDIIKLREDPVKFAQLPAGTQALIEAMYVLHRGLDIGARTEGATPEQVKRVSDAFNLIGLGGAEPGGQNTLPNIMP